MSTWALEHAAEELNKWETRTLASPRSVDTLVPFKFFACRDEKKGEGVERVIPLQPYNMVYLTNTTQVKKAGPIFPRPPLGFGERLRRVQRVRRKSIRQVPVLPVFVASVCFVWTALSLRTKEEATKEGALIS